MRALRRGQTSSLRGMCFRKVSRGLLTAHEGQGTPGTAESDFQALSLAPWKRVGIIIYFFIFLRICLSCDEAGLAHLRKRLKNGANAFG